MCVLIAQSGPTLCDPKDCRQVSLSLGFSRKDYWRGLLFPSPEDLPDSEIEPSSPALQANSLPFEPQGYLLNVNSLNNYRIQYKGYTF